MNYVLPCFGGYMLTTFFVKKQQLDLWNHVGESAGRLGEQKITSFCDALSPFREFTPGKNGGTLW